MIHSFMGFVQEDIEPISVYKLNIGENYYLEDTYGFMQSLGTYIGTLEKQTERSNGQNGKYFSRDYKDQYYYLFELVNSNHTYAIAQPKMCLHQGGFIITMYVKFYTNNWKTHFDDIHMRSKFELK